MIAQYLGEKQEAIEWLRNYDRQVTYTRNQLKKHVGEKMRLYRGTLYFDYSRTVMEVFYGDLDMRSAQSNNFIPFKQAISLHDLAKMNPDRLLVNVKNWKSIQNSSV